MPLELSLAFSPEASWVDKASKQCARNLFPSEEDEPKSDAKSRKNPQPPSDGPEVAPEKPELESASTEQDAEQHLWSPTSSHD